MGMVTLVGFQLIVVVQDEWGLGVGDRLRLGYLPSFALAFVRYVDCLWYMAVFRVMLGTD